MLCYRCGSYSTDGGQTCGVCGQTFAAQRRGPKPSTREASTSVARPTPPLEAGATFANRYAISGPTAPGAAGWVIRARDQDVDIDVALKVIAGHLLQTAEERRAFVKSTQKAQKAQHSNLVRIYDVGEAGGLVYYTMAFLEGLSLRKIIDLRTDKKQVFSLPETLPLLTQLAAGLDALERHGAHGALRPQNITVLPDMLKITGLPHHRGLPRRPFAAQLENKRGLLYLAPEARREGAIDARADVYSLAVMTAEMLTGIIFGGESLAWTKAMRQLPPQLASLLSQGLAENPHDRFVNAGAMVAAIHDAVADLQFDTQAPVDLLPHGSQVSMGPTPMGQDEATRVDAVPAESVLAQDNTPVVDMGALPAEARREPSPTPLRVVSLGAPASAEKPAVRLGKAAPAQRRPPAKNSSGRSWRLGGSIAVAFGVAVVAVAAAVWWRQDSRKVASRGLPEGVLVAELSGGREGTNPLPEPAPSESPRPRAASNPPKRSTSAKEPAPPAQPKVIELDSKPVLAATPSRQESSPAKNASAEPRRPVESLATALENAKASSNSDSRQPVRSLSSQPAPATLPTTPVAAPSPIASPPPVETKIAGCPSGMVLVDVGRAIIGSQSNDSLRGFGELDAHETSVKPFCIDAYEYPNQRGKVPMTQVTWAKAKQSCEKAGKRLCSEEEWETACKGGRASRFPVGDSLASGTCNIGDEDSGTGKLASGGEYGKCRNALGLADLAGNAAEWTSSKFEGTADKVVKGGAANQATYTGRCAARANGAASSKDAFVGFRCCSEGSSK